MSKFNVRISFKGEGDTEFHLPVVGALKIYAGKDIYLKDATTEIVEALRKYRVMLIDHKLNADAKGCYKVIEVDKIERIQPYNYRPVAVPAHNQISDLKAQLIRTNDFIPVEEAGQETAEDLAKKEAQRQADEAAKRTSVETTDPKTLLEAGLVGDKKSEVKDEKKDEVEHTEAPDGEDEKPVLPEELANYVCKTTKEKGKKFSELDERAIRKLARYSTDTVEKANANKVIEILYSNK